MKTTKNQITFMAQAISLASEKNIPVIFMVDSNEVNKDGWTDHEITEVRVMPFYDFNPENILTDEDEIRDSIADRIQQNAKDDGKWFNDELLDIAIDKEYFKYVKNVVGVMTNARSYNQGD